MKPVRRCRKKALKWKAKHFDPIQKMEDEKLERNVRKWMDEGGVYDDATMTQVAERLDTSKEQLSYFWRSKYGEGFKTWRTRTRFEHAVRLMLEHPEHTISEITGRVGIYDRHNFRKMFIKKYGTAPQKWRKKKLRK